VNGSACVLIDFEDACPADALLNTWRIRVIEAIATIVSTRRNVTRAQATIGLTIAAVPTTNADGDSCAVHLQIFPPRSTGLTANDFLMAIWEQLGGDSLTSNSTLPSRMVGVAAVRTYGGLSPLSDSIKDTVIIHSASSTLSSSFATLAAVVAAMEAIRRIL